MDIARPGTGKKLPTDFPQTLSVYRNLVLVEIED